MIHRFIFLEAKFKKILMTSSYILGIIDNSRMVLNLKNYTNDII